MLGMSGVSQSSRHCRRDCSSGIWGTPRARQEGGHRPAQRRGGGQCHCNADLQMGRE